MKTGKKEIKNIFEWLNEITFYKTPTEDISDDSWNCWNSWLAHKYVSMDIRYIELANYIQTIPYDNKHQLYQIYREMIPKSKVFLKYLKSKTKLVWFKNTLSDLIPKEIEEEILITFINSVEELKELL